MSTHRERNLAKMTETIRSGSPGAEFWVPISGIVELPDGSILVKSTTTSEAPDAEREIADFEPMRDAIRDSMAKSAELREMHKGSAKGEVPEVTFDDELRKIDATIHVVDPVAVQKVKDGHYTGVSWGGKKWVGPWIQTAMGKVRHIVKAVVDELSLADRPANPDAVLAKGERDVLVLAKTVMADEAASTLLSEGPPDVFIGDGPGTQLYPLFPGEVILNAPQARKEPTMVEAAKVAPEAAETKPIEPDRKALRKAAQLAKTQIAVAKLEKRAARLAKKKFKVDDAHAAIDSVGTAHSDVADVLGEAHDAIDAKAPDEDDLAKTARKELAKTQKAKTRELRKSARAARKTIKMAKLAKTIRRAASKSKSLSKVGKAISASNAGIIDSIHDASVQLGSMKCMGKVATGTVLDPSIAAPINVNPDSLAKADASVDQIVERLEKSLGKPFREALEATKAEIKLDLAKVAKMPAGGGPLTAPARGGPGDTSEEAVLAKVAEKFQVGSVEREALGKAATAEGIRELMAG